MVRVLACDAGSPGPILEVYLLGEEGPSHDLINELINESRLWNMIKNSSHANYVHKIRACHES